MFRELISGSSANNVFLRAKTAENSVTCIPDGGVELFHNNIKKLETTVAGATVTGTLRTGNGSTISFSDNVNLECNEIIYFEKN